MIHALDDALLAYAEQQSTPENEIVQALRKATWQKVLSPQMLSDSVQGRFLTNISRMVQPQAVLELGTFTGYATICLAAGLKSDGHIDTIESNDELCSMQDAFWKEARCFERINRHIGEALSVLPKLPGPYDLVWIDADKMNTRSYVETAIARVRIGGWILIDNVLWWGKVLDAVNSDDPTALHLHALTSDLAHDPRVRSTLLPLRDGILMMEKLAD